MDISGVSKPLPLEGAFNVRDLGGYKTVDGKTTELYKFLRSDALNNLSDDDMDYLYDYGVRHIIDMRSESESEQFSCPMIDFKDIDYFSFPLLDHIQSDGLMGSFPDSMGELYLDLLCNSGDIIADILKTFLSFESGCILFNCTAGKDRTGIISVLLLLLCGVPEETVLADYSTSRMNLEPLLASQLELLKKLGINIPSHVFDSDPNEMKKAVDYLKSTYNNVSSYLESIGLTQSEMKNLKDMLIS